MKPLSLERVTRAALATGVVDLLADDAPTMQLERDLAAIERAAADERAAPAWASPRYDYDCRLHPDYNFDTWTIRPRLGPSVASAAAEESSGEAARRLGVREASLRAKARELGDALAPGERRAAATLPSARWDEVAAAMQRTQGGPPKGFRDALLAPGRETCATAARRLRVRAEPLREHARALGFATGQGLRPPQWDMAAARIQARARKGA